MHNRNGKNKNKDRANLNTYIGILFVYLSVFLLILLQIINIPSIRNVFLKNKDSQPKIEQKAKKTKEITVSNSEVEEYQEMLNRLNIYHLTQNFGEENKIIIFVP